MAISALGDTSSASTNDAKDHVLASTTGAEDGERASFICRPAGGDDGVKEGASVLGESHAGSAEEHCLKTVEEREERRGVGTSGGQIAKSNEGQEAKAGMVEGGLNLDEEEEYEGDKGKEEEGEEGEEEGEEGYGEEEEGEEEYDEEESDDEFEESEEEKGESLAGKTSASPHDRLSSLFDMAGARARATMAKGQVKNSVSVQDYALCMGAPLPLRVSYWSYV